MTFSYYENIADGTLHCIDDALPFAIPTSWCWCRLGAVGEWQSGATPSRKVDSYYHGNIPWIKTGELMDDYLTKTEELITEKALSEVPLRLLPVNTVIIAMYGATIGKIGITTFESTTNQACCACVNPTLVLEKYLFYYLMSHKKEFSFMASGGAQPNISKEKIEATYIPVPPKPEQRRIVEKIEEYFSVLAEIEKVSAQ